MKIIAIVAMNEDRIIGDPKGGIPWVNMGLRIPEDFAHFKEITMGSPMIMGRKTFSEFPKPLPGRPHIVLTRDKWNAISEHKNVCFIEDKDDALKRAEQISETGFVFIIGGAQIYELFFPLLDEIYVTEIYIDLEEGPKLPEFRDKFKIARMWHKTERHKLAYHFEHLVRR